MRWTKLAPIALLSGLTVSTAAHAELTVVADHGGQPARPYYVAISGAGVDEADGYQARAETRAPGAGGPVREANMLPVRSRQLTPGRVSMRSLNLPATTTPFFLIGADSLSRRWLNQRGARLRELNAVGLVVDVDSAAQLGQLRVLGEGLVLRPVAGDDLAQRLGLAHYPALITADGLQQ